MSRLASLTLGLVHEPERCHAALELARQLKCERFCLYVRDFETGVSTPLAGMPWPQGTCSKWTAFVAAALPDDIIHTALPDPVAGHIVPILAMRSGDGTFAAVGDGARVSAIIALRTPLALAGAAIRGDAAARRAAHLEEELARAEDSVDRISRTRDDFLSTLSHELRTPLNAMLGWLQLLRLPELDDRTRTHALDVLERSARSQQQVVADLLDVSRIVTGNMQLTFEPVELGAIARDAVAILAPAAAAKGVALVVHVEPIQGDVRGDSQRLRQVIWNLVENAVKFTPPGGAVDVRVHTVGVWAGIDVTDTGIGIAPELLPQVFKRFLQGDATVTRAFGGLGLGLAIVRHLVELHGGSVRATSAGPGRGATFGVQLPIAAR